MRTYADSAKDVGHLVSVDNAKPRLIDSIEDLDAWQLVRAQVHACAHKCAYMRRANPQNAIFRNAIFTECIECTGLVVSLLHLHARMRASACIYARAHAHVCTCASACAPQSARPSSLFSLARKHSCPRGPATETQGNIMVHNFLKNAHLICQCPCQLLYPPIVSSCVCKRTCAHAHGRAHEGGCKGTHRVRNCPSERW